jgi:YVTN family beta-propeller protein
MSTLPRLVLLGSVLLALPWLLPGQASGPPAERQGEPAAIRLRRPVALMLTESGKKLVVANRESGTLIVLDTQTQRIVRETRIGRRLSGLAGTRARDLLLAADEEAGEVILLRPQGGALGELKRVKIASAVGVALSADDKLAAVASLWPRQLAILDLAAVRTTAILDLPFAPRRLLPLPGGSRVLVADAFGGRLAVVDLKRRAVESVRGLGAHNVRGLALSRDGKSVWLAHQVLHAHGRTTTGDIVTGNVITNNVRALALATVLDPLADVLRDDRIYALGDIERGAGDPAEVAEGPDGQVLVTLAGVNELAIGRPAEATWTRLAVGPRPTALVVDEGNKRAYVANTFGDSLSVIDLKAARVVAEVGLGKLPELRPEERGELLFHDASLSHDAWYSCQSCHPDGHTNGRLNDNFTDGSFGTPKRVLTLRGVQDSAPYAWDGGLADLEGQVRTSLRSTMQGPEPKAEQVRDLTAFLRALAPPPAVLKAREAIDAEALKRGRRVFKREKCATCHTAPAYTSAKTFDVGLRDEAGRTHFNPPSLRGLSQAGPYFHDNRALSLEEVFTRYRHQVAGTLTKEEVRDLLHFLGSL